MDVSASVACLRRTDLEQAHLRNFVFYLHAFEYREARLLRAVVNKLYSLRHLGQFESWNKCLDLAKELALAHAERIVVEQFIENVRKADSSLQPMLSALCSLHCLSAIQGRSAHIIER